MGAWGMDVFEDDTACDVFDNLLRSEDQVKRVVDSLTAPVPHNAEEGEIDYDECYEKVISAIFLAIWLDIDTKLPLARMKYSSHVCDSIEKTYSKAKLSPDFQELEKRGESLRIQAREWLKSLSENPSLSELCELWMESSESYKKWKKNIDWVIDFVS